jgi:NADH-quinone oxidoreductase subunit F
MNYNAKILSDNNILLKNIGKIDPQNINEALKNGGYNALRKALKLSSKEIIDEVMDSGLKGRGGAGFPTGRKWLFTYNAKSEQKYLICNADEGEPGTVKDRIFMEGDPHLLIEGMIITAYAIGATKSFIYVRGEYSKSIETLQNAIIQAKENNFLGKNILGSGFDFEIEIASGGGAYVCGEETALIESIEGKRGEPRLKPPYPPVEGLFGKPTIVNNVETLCNIPYIIEIGAKNYKKIGSPICPGPKIFILSGDVNEPGIVEETLDVSSDYIINHYGKGVKDNEEIKYAQIGGSSGNLFTPKMMKEINCYEKCSLHQVSYGTGSIFVVSKKRNIVKHLLIIAEFFEHESCGKCTPCREGTHRIKEIIKKFDDKKGSMKDLKLLEDLAIMMRKSAFCGLGQACVNPILDGIKHFKNEILAN